MWKIAGTFSVAAVAVAQETREVNSDWQVKTGKDYNPNPGGCPFELRGARLSECETHADTSGWAAFSVDSDGNCCFKDGEVHNMLESLVTSHDHDFYYTLSIAVATAQETPEVNSDWQVKTGKDYNPNPGGCPYELRGARLSECETHAETGGWAAFSVDSNGNCCFKDGEVQEMLESLVTSHDHDFHYTLSVAVAVTEEKPQVNSDWQVKTGKDYNPNPGGCPYELRGARLSECETHAETGGWGAFSVDSNGNCCFKDGEVHDMLGSLVTSHDHDFYYTLSVVAVESDWQVKNAKDYNPGGCPYELRGARLSECETHAETGGWSAFTVDTNGNCCFKDGEVQEMLESLVTSHDHDFHYTLTVVAVADSDGWQRESKKGLDKHYDPYHNCTYALRGARLSECEVHAEAASFAAFTRDINGTCCFKDGEVQDLLNSLVTNNDTDFYYQHPESMLNTVEVV